MEKAKETRSEMEKAKEMETGSETWRECSEVGLRGAATSPEAAGDWQPEWSRCLSSIYEYHRSNCRYLLLGM